ncbi:MAG: DUF4215 domain-containing protein [Polyangia bacterium]
MKTASRLRALFLAACGLISLVAVVGCSFDTSQLRPLADGAAEHPGAPDAPATTAGRSGYTDAGGGGGAAGGQSVLPADASPSALDTGGQVAATDSGLTALADAGAEDAAYVAPRCGDGIVVPPEQCDDGNTVAGDGCSPTCKIEIGYKCSGSPSVCTPTICGNGIVEGIEGCDDGNTMPFDGCSEDCQIELACSGASCTSKCGDGVVVPPEQCDDGNTVAGDGCSPTCQVEPGWTCSQPPLGNQMMVPVIYRDFRFHNPSDFEPGVTGSNGPITGIVETSLDQDAKPVFTGLTTAHIESTSTFAEWYRTSQGVNDPTASKLSLWDNGQGAYVNRYGPNGEQWNVTTIAYSCGTVGGELLDANGDPQPCTSQLQQSATNPTGIQTDCQRDAALGYQMLNCYLSGTTYMATFLVNKADGNPLFFPIDSDPFSADQLEAAQVPSIPAGLYDDSGTWPWDVDASGNKILHNFSFTTEARYWFLYDKTKTYTLDFVSNDDMWVFINNQLAVDLGGIHTPVEGSITLDAATASGLSLVDGKVYEVAVFHAQRQTTCSAYEMTLIGFNTAPSECIPCVGGLTPGGAPCGSGTGGQTTVSSDAGTGGAGGTAGASGTADASATGVASIADASTAGTTDVSSGDTEAFGGADGSAGSTSSAPPPTGSLAVWVAQKTTGGGMVTLGGQITLNLRIDNKTAETVDTSTVTLRYWYQDEGLGTALVLASNYVSIGYSNQGKVTGVTAIANPSPVAGADHYLQFSFSGTLAAQGDKATNDQFNVQVTAHSPGYTGAVDVTNDYSYDGGAALLYEQKITLHDQSGNVIWGTPPG